MAASYYGVPRTTTDSDFLVAVSDTQLDKFLDVLDKFGLDVDKDSILRRLRTGHSVVSL